MWGRQRIEKKRWENVEYALSEWGFKSCFYWKAPSHSSRPQLRVWTSDQRDDASINPTYLQPAAHILIFNSRLLSWTQWFPFCLWSQRARMLHSEQSVVFQIFGVCKNVFPVKEICCRGEEEEEEGTFSWIPPENKLLISHHKTAELCQEPLAAPRPHPSIRTQITKERRAAASNSPDWLLVSVNLHKYARRLKTLTFH